MKTTANIMTTVRRFVILRHEIGPKLNRTSQTHLDWMFELDGRLRTFATEILDPLASCENVVAESLADHRISYLDYAGEISDGRGTVSRVAQGEFKLIEDTATRWHAQLYWEPNAQPTAQPNDKQARDYRIRSELWVEDIRGVLQLRLSATRYDTNR